MAKKKDQRVKNEHAVILGRLGGLVGGLSRSERKVRAVRENGKMGGRPIGVKSRAKTKP